MASVQELLALAEAKQSPIPRQVAGAIGSLFQGIEEAKKKRLDTINQYLQIQKAMREQEQSKIEREQVERLLKLAEKQGLDVKQTAKIGGMTISVSKPKQKEPGRGQFVGVQDNKPVIFRPDTNTFELGEFPVSDQLGPRVAPQLPASKAESLAGLRNSLSLIKRAKDLYEPEFVGPIQARVGRIQEYGLLGGPKKNETEFRTIMLRDFNQQIKEITGAQLSEEEAERILKSLPTIDLGDEAFKKRLDATIDISERILAEKEKAFSQAGFRGFERPEKIINIKSPKPGVGNELEKITNEELEKRINELRGKR